MERSARVILGLCCGVYLLFAVACARLAVVYGDDRGLSVGEGAFTLLGGAALAAAMWRPRRWTWIALVGTLPLVAWFLATPWNSGPPFLVASLVAPLAAGALVVRQRLRAR